MNLRKGQYFHTYLDMGALANPAAGWKNNTRATWAESAWASSMRAWR